MQGRGGRGGDELGPADSGRAAVLNYMADGTRAQDDAAKTRGAKVVVPPTKTAAVSRRGPRSAARDRTIRRVQKIGRRRWKKESGYHRQGTVENACFRYKSILRGRLRARHPRAQETEALLSCNILNRMSEFGMPVSVAIER